MTTEAQHGQEQASPPEDLVDQVKEALEHLYDLDYLQRHPITQEVGLATELGSETAGQRLRRELASAIETLSPGVDVPFRAPQARIGNLMVLHYVEGMTVQEAAHKLGVSRRQAHRDLRRGIEEAASILWARRSVLATQIPRAVQLSSLEAEMARFESHTRSTNVCQLLQSARKAVEPLAEKQGVRFDVEDSPEPVMISTDPVMAEQVLVGILSHAVEQAHPGPLRLTFAARDEGAFLLLNYFPASETARASAVNLVVTQLVDRLGWTITQKDLPAGQRAITLGMRVLGPAVLVIDDNQGLVELLERYLTDQACQVIAAVNGQDGLRLAQQLVPNAIVLDVMMPEISGWEVLQRLRNNAKTADIPVVICSVFDNPELAYSLGADLFLPKPVSRRDVLGALHQLGVT